MARQPRTLKPDSKPEEHFTNLMLVAAIFTSSRGGIEAAKQALHDAGSFIQQAGGVGPALRALEVLELFKLKINNPTSPPAAVVAPDEPALVPK